MILHNDLHFSLEKPALIQRTKSEIAIDELGLKGSSKLWIGKDYCNNIHKDFVDLNVPFEGKTQICIVLDFKNKSLK